MVESPRPPAGCAEATLPASAEEFETSPNMLNHIAAIVTRSSRGLCLAEGGDQGASH
jgi:hypothetical protein